MVDEFVVGFEDAVGEPVVAHELPDVFDRVEFGGFRRQGDGWSCWAAREVRRHVPACLIDEEHGVGARRDDLGDLGEM